MLASFTKALADGPPLKRGAELVFELQQAGVRLVMGKHVVELKGKALSEALLATYLDGKAVAPDFKEQVLKGGLEKALSKGPPQASRGSSEPLGGRNVPLSAQRFNAKRALERTA